MQRCLNPIFQHPLFLLLPLFQRYLIPQVRWMIKIANKHSVRYYLCLSRLVSRIHPFIFLLQTTYSLSFSRMLVEFSLTPVHSTMMVETNFYMMALQSCDPDVNFINKKIQNLDMQYLMLGEFHNFLDNSSDQFSVLHLIIRNIKKNFAKL